MATDPSSSIGYRHGMLCLGFFGFFIVYALRVNLSVAVTHMAPEFGWDSKVRGLVLSSFFYGYISTQLFGGWLASKYGAKWVFFAGVTTTTVLTLIIPLVASHLSLFLAVRVIQGLLEAFTFPSMHQLLSVWSHPSERTWFATLVYSGAYVGTVISMPLSGYLCGTNFLGGWPSVFYLFGGVALLWCVAWAALAHSSPAVHPRISAREREYLRKGIAQGDSATRRRGRRRGSGKPASATEEYSTLLTSPLLRESETQSSCEAVFPSDTSESSPMLVHSPSPLVATAIATATVATAPYGTDASTASGNRGQRTNRGNSNAKGVNRSNSDGFAARLTRSLSHSLSRSFRRSFSKTNISHRSSSSSWSSSRGDSHRSSGSGGGGKKRVRGSVPWAAIFRNRRVWALTASCICYYWGFYTMLTWLPTYMSAVLHESDASGGLLAALPFLVLAVSAQLCGRLSDAVRARRWLTTTQTRKLAMALSACSAAPLLLLCAYSSRRATIVTSMVLGVGCSGIALAALQPNSLDLSPRYASLLMALGNTAATVPGIASPLVTGALVPHNTVQEWRQVFVLSAALYLLAALIFVLFGAGERQPDIDDH